MTTTTIAYRSAVRLLDRAQTNPAVRADIASQLAVLRGAMTEPEAEQITDAFSKLAHPSQQQQSTPADRRAFAETATSGRAFALGEILPSPAGLAVGDLTLGSVELQPGFFDGEVSTGTVYVQTNKSDQELRGAARAGALSIEGIKAFDAASGKELPLDPGATRGTTRKKQFDDPTAQLGAHYAFKWSDAVLNDRSLAVRFEVTVSNGGVVGTVRTGIMTFTRPRPSEGMAG